MQSERQKTQPASIRVEADPDAGYVVLERHYVVPQRFTARIEHVGGEPVKRGTGSRGGDTKSGIEVELVVDVADDGTARCSGLEVHPHEGEQITSEMLRRVPVAQLVRHAVTVIARKVEELPDGDLRLSGLRVAAETSLSTRRDRDEFYEQYSQGARRPRRGSPLAEDNLRQVADLYRAAVERGDPPTQTVAEQMHVARSTAARWVGMARKQALLGPALRGRAGEKGRAK